MIKSQKLDKGETFIIESVELCPTFIARNPCPPAAHAIPRDYSSLLLLQHPLHCAIFLIFRRSTELYATFSLRIIFPTDTFVFERQQK